MLSRAASLEERPHLLLAIPLLLSGDLWIKS